MSLKSEKAELASYEVFRHNLSSNIVQHSWDGEYLDHPKCSSNVQTSRTSDTQNMKSDRSEEVQISNEYLSTSSIKILHSWTAVDFDVLDLGVDEKLEPEKKKFKVQKEKEHEGQKGQSGPITARRYVELGFGTKQSFWKERSKVEFLQKVNTYLLSDTSSQEMQVLSPIVTKIECDI